MIIDIAKVHLGMFIKDRIIPIREGVEDVSLWGRNATKGYEALSQFEKFLGEGGLPQRSRKQLIFQFLCLVDYLINHWKVAIDNRIQQGIQKHSHSPF